MSHKEREIVKFVFTQLEINEKQNKWQAVCVKPTSAKRLEKHIVSHDE